MPSNRPTRRTASRWLKVAAALLPLLFFLVAPALGLHVGPLVLLLALVWAVWMLLQRGDADVDEAVGEARGSMALEGPAAPASVATGAKGWVNGLLVVATLVTTTFAGAAHQGVNLLTDPGRWAVGIPYALGLMLVLGVHEMGHWLAARRHGIRASLPYFVPVPFGLGTFGAFIGISGEIRTRRQLFDVGVAGPLAGLAVAIPALALGLQWSRVAPAGLPAGMPFGHGVDVHASILLALVSKLAIPGAVASGHALVLHPLAFAGWLGIMITALNLLPVGQLDGGHVAHALLGARRADWVGKGALGAMVLLGVFVWTGLLFWAVFVYLVGGTRGAAPSDDATPLDGWRRALAWGAYALLAFILVPLPHVLAPALGVHCPYV